MKFALIATAVAVLAGCGSAPHRATPARTQVAKAQSPTLLVFRRIRYEGATLRTMYLHADGSVHVDIPSGGAGGARQDGRMAPGTLAAVRRQIARTPWDHLSPRKRPYLAGSGAYFIVRRGDSERVLSSAGMSEDLVPLVRRLNAMMNGHGVHVRTHNRFYQD